MDAVTAIPSTKKQVDFDTRVSQYVKLRDEIKRLDDEHKKKMEKYRNTLEQLNGSLLQHLNTVNAESVRTSAGTVYKTKKQSASIADQEAFWTYVVTTANWDLLDRRANVSAVADYLERKAKEKELDPTIEVAPPPGINFNVSYVVGVRRA